MANEYHLAEVNKGQRFTSDPSGLDLSEADVRGDFSGVRINSINFKGSRLRDQSSSEPTSTCAISIIRTGQVATFAVPPSMAAHRRLVPAVLNGISPATERVERFSAAAMIGDPAVSASP
jgi:hypothetical protein